MQFRESGTPDTEKIDIAKLKGDANAILTILGWQSRYDQACNFLKENDDDPETQELTEKLAESLTKCVGTLNKTDLELRTEARDQDDDMADIDDYVYNNAASRKRKEVVEDLDKILQKIKYRILDEEDAQKINDEPSRKIRERGVEWDKSREEREHQLELRLRPEQERIEALAKNLAYEIPELQYRWSDKSRIVMIISKKGSRDSILWILPKSREHRFTISNKVRHELDYCDVEITGEVTTEVSEAVQRLTNLFIQPNTKIMSEKNEMQNARSVDVKWNPLKSVSAEVLSALDSGKNSRALVLEAIYSGTFDGADDVGMLESELVSRDCPEKEAEILAPWLMQKRREFLANIDESKKAEFSKWNPLSSVSNEVSQALDAGKNSRALILEAIFSGTFDGVADAGSLEYELEGRGFPKEHAEVIAPWLIEKRKEFIAHVGN